MTLCSASSLIPQSDQLHPSGKSQKRLDVGGLFILGLFLLVACISRAAFLAKPFHNDGGLYVYMGKTVATGGILYQDFYENKPPGVGLFMATLWRVFGNNWLAYVTLQFVLALSAAWMMARTAGRVIGEHARRPTLIFGIVWLNFCWVVFSGFQLETVQAFFAALAACAAMEAIAGDDLRDTILAGLAAGMAAAIKPTGLAVCGAMMIGLLFRWREIGIGRIIKHAIVLAIMAAIPNIGVAWWVIKSGLTPMMPHLFHEIALYGKETPLEALDWFKLVQVVIFLGFPLVVRGVLFRRGEKGLTPSPKLPLLIFALAWFAIEAFGVFMQGRMYVYHFLVILPPATILYGMMPRRDRWIPIASSLAPLAIISLWWSFSAVWHLPDGYQTCAISQYIIDHAAPTDRVYADQYPRVVFQTGLDYGARYGTLFYFVNHDDAPKEYCDQLLLDFEHRQPKFIVVGQNHEALKQEHRILPMLRLRPKRLENFMAAWGREENYIATNYQQVLVSDGYILYQRRDDAGTLAFREKTGQVQPTQTAKLEQAE